MENVYQGATWFAPQVVRVNENSITDKELHDSDLTMLFDGLNALAAVPWKVNKNVLEEVEKVWS